MTIEVHVSRNLRKFSGAADVAVSAATVQEALEDLEKHHPALYAGVCDETGAVRRHVNLFVNSDLVCVRDPSGLKHPLQSGDVLTIWEAVSGG